MDSNPEISALKANRNAIDQELEGAKSLGRPKLDVNAAGGYIWTDQVSGGGLSALKDDTYRGSVGATLSVPMFDGYKTKFEVRRQGHRVDSARNRVGDTANSLALQAVQAYLEVQRAASVVDIAHQNVNSHQRIQSRVSTRVGGGRAAGAELTQVRARLAGAQANLAEAEAQLLNAKALYLAVVGTTPGHLSPVRLPHHYLPHSVQDAVHQAYARSPALRALEADSRAAEAAVGTARSEYYPKVNVEVGANHKYDGDRDYGRKTDFSALLVMRMNVYNGGRDTASVAEAGHRARQAYDTLANAGRLVEKEIRLSWFARDAAARRITALSQQRAQNRQLVAAYSSQFDIGQRSLIDILDAQNELFIAETGLANEEFVASFNAFRILAAIGVLVEALGFEMPEEALVEADIARGWITIGHAEE